MNTPFIDHSFNKIVEGRHETALVKKLLVSKLELLESVGNQIVERTDADHRQNVLGYTGVKRALEQCLDYVSNPSSNVTNEDYHIYYEYSSNRLKEAEEIIDEELHDYGF